jgi:hypothetical protein
MGLAPRPLARPVGLLALGTLRAELALKFRSLRPDVMIGVGPDMCSLFTRLFWVAVDRLDYAVTLARCWLVDLNYGPEPPTPADEKRGADREQLQKAFPGVDFDGAVIAEEEQGAQAQAKLTTPVTASGASSPLNTPSAASTL